MPKIPEKVRIGDEITMERWNTLVEYVRSNWITTGTGGGLKLVSGPMGKCLTAARPGAAYPAVTTTSAAGRSGTTLGAASVTLQYANAGSLAATSATDIKVYNISSSSIASGIHCWVQQDGNQDWWFTAVEC